MNIKSASKAVGEGIKSVPQSIWFGIQRTYRLVKPIFVLHTLHPIWGDDEKIIEAISDAIVIRLEDQRAFKIIMKAIKGGSSADSPIRQTISIIVEVYLNHLPPCAQRKIANKAGLAGVYYGSRISTKMLATLITRRVMSRVVQSTVWRTIVSQAVGAPMTVAMIYGIFEEASQASRRLKLQYPYIYSKLRTYDLDMIYFIIEGSMQDYLESIKNAKLYPVPFKQQMMVNFS